jgi:hypothetical protein
MKRDVVIAWHAVASLIETVWRVVISGPTRAGATSGR